MGRKVDPDAAAGDPQTVWSRDLLARADEAIAGAAFDDWSGFDVSREHVKAARQAATAWRLLANHLVSLRSKSMLR